MIIEKLRGTSLSRKLFFFFFFFFWGGGGGGGGFLIKTRPASRHP